MASFNWKKKIEDSLRDVLIIDHNYRSSRNIFWVKGGKHKTTKGIPGSYVSTKTYWWNLWRRAGERLCSLQKMDQRVNTTTKIL